MLPSVSAQPMPGGGELLPAGANGLARRIGLEGPQVARLFDATVSLVPSCRTMSIFPMPPSRPPPNQKSATSMRPVVPKMRSTLSCSTATEQDTSATMPPGKRSTAEAHSSTPVCAEMATPATLSGSRNGLPAAAPAISRAMETG